MTMKELAERLTPGRWTESDGFITLGSGCLSGMESDVFEADAVVGDPVQTSDGTTWTVADSSGRYIVTETQNGDVVIDPEGGWMI